MSDRLLSDEELAEKVSYLIDTSFALQPEILDLINTQKRLYAEKEKMDTQFMLMSDLQTKMMPLMVHTTQAGFPSMTAEILRDIWDWRNLKFKEAAIIIAPRAESED